MVVVVTMMTQHTEALVVVVDFLVETLMVVAIILHNDFLVEVTNTQEIIQLVVEVVQVLLEELHQAPQEEVEMVVQV